MSKQVPSTKEEKRIKHAEKMRRWRADNPERAKESTRKSVEKWREEHPEEARDANREAAQRRRENDPEAARVYDRERKRAWRAAKVTGKPD